MMCAFCKGTETQNILDKFLINIDSTVLIVNNVPTLECVQCGEKYYSNDVSEELEVIVEKARTIRAEIVMVDYDNSDKMEVVR